MASINVSKFLIRRLATFQKKGLQTLTKSALLGGQQLTSTSRGVATASASLGQTISMLAEENPHKDAVRYDHKNIKWSFKHLEYYSDALALGLAETGLIPGDAMLSWLPLHFAEQHVLQLACSKGGFILYHLDPSLAITDREAAKTSLKNALEVTEATCLFSQQAGDDVNYTNLCKEVIPEVRFFDIYEGMQFFTPRFPNLRFPIHTGLDVEAGECLGLIPYKYFIVPVSSEFKKFSSNQLSTEVDGSTPLMGELIVDKNGSVKKGKVLTNDEVLKSMAWPQVCSMVKKEYIEVEGVGVVF